MGVHCYANPIVYIEDETGFVALWNLDGSVMHFYCCFFPRWNEHSYFVTSELWPNNNALRARNTHLPLILFKHQTERGEHSLRPFLPPYAIIPRSALSWRDPPRFRIPLSFEHSSCGGKYYPILTTFSATCFSKGHVKFITEYCDPSLLIYPNGF